MGSALVKMLVDGFAKFKILLARSGQLLLLLCGCGWFYIAFDGSVRFLMLLVCSRR